MLWNLYPIILLHDNWERYKGSRVYKDLITKGQPNFINNYINKFKQ